MGATKPEAVRWPGPIIPFEIDADLDNPDRILTAIRNHWEVKTNIRFVRRARQSDFVLFRHGQRCNSPVGQQGGIQHVTLIPNCSVPEIIHEIGHASGLIHEHQRLDRGTFVQVQPNVEPDHEHDFELIDDSINLTDYDFRSIMHYPPNFFSVDGSPTLVPTDPSAVLDTSITFTSLDLQAINELYPNVGIVRRSDSGFEGAGQVSEIAVTHNSTASDVVTAVRTEAGTLRLIRWIINESGGIQRRGDSGNDAGKATSISISRGRLFVTACRNDSDNLFLISWSATPDGGFVREGASRDDAAGEADLIRILALTDDLFVTACRAGNGNLKLITWRLVGGSLERLLEKEAGEVSEISLIRVRQVGTNHQIATSVRAGNDHVVIIVWNVAEDGNITRLGENRDIDEGDLIESCIHPATGLLVVSCRAANGKLKVITLSVSENGGAVSRRLDSGDQAGEIRNNALMARPTGVLSAVKDGNDNLKLIGWDIDADGRVNRLGDSAPNQAGGIGLVRLGNDTGQPEAPVLTCVQTEEDDLKLISWDDQPANGELITISTVIDLNGRWTDGSTRSAAISAAFTSLTIDMSAFNRPAAHGSILDSSTITVTFPDDKTFTGTLQPPNLIRWSNGSAWRKV